MSIDSGNLVLHMKLTDAGMLNLLHLFILYDPGLRVRFDIHALY